jgi:hypothetical protein
MILNFNFVYIYKMLKQIFVKTCKICIFGTICGVVFKSMDAYAKKEYKYDYSYYYIYENKNTK